MINTQYASPIGRQMNIHDLLERMVRQHNDKPFIIFIDNDDREEIITYGQFGESVTRLAFWLHDQGIQKGDFVLTHLPNSPGFLVALHACAKIGAVMIPSIIFDVADDMEYKINFSKAKIVITDGEYYPLFESILPKCPTVTAVLIYRSEEKISGAYSWEDMLSGSSTSLPEVAIDPLDMAQMMFTSGTTARPKGVMLTHANFLYIGEIVARSFSVTPEDRYLLVLPLFHVNAQCISYFACLAVGASMVICERFSASRFSPIIRQYDCTICSLVAASLRMILAQPEHPLDRENKLLRCPYAIAITDDEWDTFENRFGTTLIDLYGLTETLAPCTIMPIWGEHRRGSVGWPNFGLEIRTVDENRNDLPVDQVGEIAVKGQPGYSLFKGYYNNPGATADALDENGWFYTGDYGKVDADGYVYFIDRKKDVIKRAGENIAAAEVERVLSEHPGIEEAVVVGVPDKIRDEAVMAIIRPMAGEELSEAAVKEFCRDKMAKFKVPEHIKITRADFPKTSIGKIRKNIIRDDILEDWEVI